MLRTTALHVMRLANMVQVHPRQAADQCDRCGHVVAVYPSGQAVIRRFGRPGVELVCDVCTGDTLPPGAVPAPGALEEKRQSVPKSKGH